MTKDPYEILRLARNATPAEIKRAYRRLARAMHPDRNPDDPSAETRFKEVARAFEILSDPARRALFDEFGHEGLREGFRPPRGGAGAGRRSQAVSCERGADVRADLHLGFGEALAGTTRAMRLRVDAPCATCGGAGRAAGRRCRSCSGRGARPVDRRVEIRVPRGARDGETLIMRGRGAPGARGGPCGDLRVRLVVPTPPGVRIDGDDIHLRLPVTLPEAYAGARIPLRTPASEIDLVLPRGVSSGTRMRVRGHGMPARRSGQAGDLILEVHIVLPDSADPRTADRVAALREDYAADPRSCLRDLFVPVRFT